MTINVRVVTNTPKTKATVASGVIMARTLDELLDVDLSGVKDKYVHVRDNEAPYLWRESKPCEEDFKTFEREILDQCKNPKKKRGSENKL